MASRPTRVWFALSIILVLGLSTRIAWDWRQGSDPASLSALPDQLEYLQLGQNLLHSQSLEMGDPRFQQRVLAYRTPGYPFLIWACLAKPGAIRVVQAILDISTALAIFLLARRWLEDCWALVASGLVAFNPYMIFFSGTILSETLFICLMCWGLALLVLSDGPWPAGRGKMFGWIGGAVLLATSVLVRPGALLLPVILGFGAVLCHGESDSASRKKIPLPVGAFMLLLTGAVLFPWAARNRIMLGSWIWTTTNEGITRYDGFNPDATGASDQSFLQWMPWTADMTEIGRNAYFSDLARQWIDDNPIAAVKLAAIKLARTWSPVPLSDQYGHGLSWWAGLIFGSAFELLVVIGLIRGRLPRAVKLLLLLPAIYLSAAVVLSVGSLRYRIPAEAPMAIIAAGGVATLVRPRRKPQVAGELIFQNLN